MIEPWVSNYLHLRPRKDRRGGRDFYLAQIFWLAVIARGVGRLIDSTQIKGNARAERLCRWAQATICRMADFSVIDPERSEYLAQIRQAQKRLNALIPSL